MARISVGGASVSYNPGGTAGDVIDFLNPSDPGFLGGIPGAAEDDLAGRSPERDYAGEAAAAAAGYYGQLGDMSEEAFELWKENYGPDSPYGLAARHNLLRAIQEYGPDSDVARQAREDYLSFSNYYGPDSMVAGMSRRNFGQASQLYGDLIEESKITPGALTAARSRATTDVEAEYTRSLAEQERRNQSMGLDPSSPAARAMSQRMSLKKGSDRAGAANNAALNERVYRTGLGMNLYGNQPVAPTAEMANAPTPGYLLNPDTGGSMMTTGVGGMSNAAGGSTNLAGVGYQGNDSQNQAPWWVEEAAGIAGTYAGRSAKDGGHVPGFGMMAPVDADGGGHLTGPGTETSDDIPARLSHNEYVVPAFAVVHHGTRKLDQLVEQARKGQPGVPKRVAGEQPREPGLGMMSAADGGEVRERTTGQEISDWWDSLRVGERAERAMEQIGDDVGPAFKRFWDKVTDPATYSLGERIGRMVKSADGGHVPGFGVVGMAEGGPVDSRWQKTQAAWDGGGGGGMRLTPWERYVRGEISAADYLMLENTEGREPGPRGFPDSGMLGSGAPDEFRHGPPGLAEGGHVAAPEEIPESDVLTRAILGLI